LLAIHSLNTSADWQTSAELQMAQFPSQLPSFLVLSFELETLPHIAAPTIFRHLLLV
jgi:hypothetical protein